MTSQELVAMTERTDRENLTIDHLLHPANAYVRPADVLRDSDLTSNEKRAILASWASDASAIEASPELRAPPNGVVVSFDEIMDALKSLDGEVRADKVTRLMERADRLRDLCRGGRSLFG